MKPSQNSRPARVTAKAGAPSTAKKKPCSAPMAAPAATAKSTAAHSGQPWLTARTAAMALAAPLTEPTDRSISPSSSTKTMPTEIMPVPTMVTEMSLRFCADRKLEFRLWKTMQMMIRPRTTGMDPSSPALILRLNSPT
ncbi:hypothetical protein QFZ64_005322 [Streptomyces sp. B3I8]|nr:hypothetical protein [Streptomyces sp. B3I8]